MSGVQMRDKKILESATNCWDNLTVNKGKHSLSVLSEWFAVGKQVWQACVWKTETSGGSRTSNYKMEWAVTYIISIAMHNFAKDIFCSHPLGSIAVMQIWLREAALKCWDNETLFGASMSVSAHSVAKVVINCSGIQAPSLHGYSSHSIG